MARWLASGVFAVFVGVLVSGLMLPVYTDEVGWRLHERAGIDGIDKLMSDLCGPSTLVRPPWFMMPVRYYSAFFNTAFAEPVFVRLSGVAYALLAAAMLFALIRRIARSAGDRPMLTMFGFGLMGLGIMPYQLVTSRPEQPILLAALAALLLAFGRDAAAPSAGTPPPPPVWRAWAISAAILVSAVIGYSYHFKAILLMPLFLACLFYASRGRAAMAPKLIAAGLMSAAALVSLSHWVHRLECSDYAPLTSTYSKISLSVMLLEARSFSDLLAVIGQALENLSVVRYMAVGALHADSMSNWLPLLPVGESQAFGLFLCTLAAWAVVGLIVASSGARALGESGLRRWPEKRLVLALALLAAVAVWAGTQRMANFYEAAYVLPLMVLAAVLLISANDGLRYTAFWRERAGIAMGALGLANMVIAAFFLTPPHFRALHASGYVPGQDASVGLLGYRAARRDVVRAAGLCGIRPEARPRRLLLDDVTYFTFMDSHMPDHRFGVVPGSVWEPKDPAAYLRSRGSDGVVMTCRFLPESLRRKAKSQGQFCCVAKDDL